jgi:hypothetical protein
MRTLRAALALGIGGLAATLVPAAANPDVPRTVGTSSEARQAPGGSLAISPATYVAGQAVTFTGSLGVPGVRKVRLQLHMNRPGDRWFAVRGFSGKTAANGGFTFDFRAPAMFGIRYRVVSGKIATAPVTFNAKAQDLTMWVAGERPDNEHDPGQPVAGVPFTVAV